MVKDYKVRPHPIYSHWWISTSNRTFWRGKIETFCLFYTWTVSSFNQDLIRWQTINHLIVYYVHKTKSTWPVILILDREKGGNLLQKVQTPFQNVITYIKPLCLKVSKVKTPRIPKKKKDKLCQNMKDYIMNFKNGLLMKPQNFGNNYDENFFVNKITVTKKRGFV